MHRPYPNADRALHQLDRHHVPQPALPPSEFTLKMAAQANAVLSAMAETLRPWREAIDAMQARPWHPNFTFDPATNRFEKWPAA